MICKEKQYLKGTFTPFQAGNTKLFSCNKMLCSSGAKAVDKENAHYEIDGEQKYLGIYTDVHAVICECRR